MKIVISGASGLIGSVLVPYLRENGHEVVTMVRRHKLKEGERFWDPQSGEIDVRGLSGADAIINLSGANVADGRWTEKRKQEIRASRISSVRTLVEGVKLSSSKPSVMINASATGYYGDRGDEEVDESSSAGRGFLAEVCQEWEQEANAFSRLGIRTVCLRLGVVMSGEGGALSKMLPAFRWGLGGRLGSGRQWFSWIAITDLLSIFSRVLSDETLEGPINAVSPQLVTNAEFTRTLGRILRRPTLVPVPGVMLRVLFGEMADEALLSGAKVRPKVLLESGFSFEQANLEKALRTVLRHNVAGT